MEADVNSSSKGQATSAEPKPSETLCVGESSDEAALVLNTKKKSSSLPVLQNEGCLPYENTQTLPPNMSAVKPFTAHLTKEMSGVTWYSTVDTFHSSGDLMNDSKRSLDDEQSQGEINESLEDNNERQKCIEAERDSKVSDSEDEQGILTNKHQIDLATMNTETRMFVRSSALDILAAFPKSETVSSRDKQCEQPRIDEDPDDDFDEASASDENKITKRSYSYKKATKRTKSRSVEQEKQKPAIIPSWSSTTNNEKVKVGPKKKKEHEASFSSVSIGSDSSKEGVDSGRGKKGKGKKNKQRPKSSGFMNLFRGKSEPKEGDSVPPKEELQKARKPVQQPESSHAPSTSKNNQLNRMDSFRKLFKRPKDSAATRDSVSADDKKGPENIKCLDISSPIVKPNFQPKNLVDRDVIIAQRSMAYQLDKQHKIPLKKEDTSENGIAFVPNPEDAGLKSTANGSHIGQPVPPVRWKHLEKKRLSKALDPDDSNENADIEQGREIAELYTETGKILDHDALNGHHNDDLEESQLSHSTKEGVLNIKPLNESEANPNNTNNNNKTSPTDITDTNLSTTTHESVPSSQDAGGSLLCQTPPAIVIGKEEYVDDVFEGDVSLNSDQEKMPIDTNKTSSIGHRKPKWQSVGSSDVSKEAIHVAVRKNKSFPAGKLSAPSSPEPKRQSEDKPTPGRHMSIFGRLPSSFRFEHSEAPTMLTDLVPTSFPAMSTDRRSQIVLELFTTERTYVRGLETMIELFQKPMLSSMDEKDVETLFSNINDIFSVNKDLLFLLWEKLKHWSNDSCIAQIFISMEERFKIYAIYCKNFDKADTAYKQRLKRNKEFERFLKACYADALCQPGLDLPAYLITIVQRIPRYLLLLKDLRNKTTPSHPDYDNLNQAMIRMHKVAEYINSQLQEVHSKKALQELRSTVIGLKAYEVRGRTLLKEAEVCLMSPKRQYKCLLFNDIMVFAVQGPKERSEIEMTLELRTLWFEDLKKHDPQTSKCDAIELFTPHRPYTMYTSSRVDKRVWIQKLRTAIVNLFYGPDCDDADVIDITRRKASDTYIDGSVYCGEYFNAKRDGHGVMAWPNRTRYEGSWLDDERHGDGQLTYYTGEKYVGSWVADKKHGQGKQTYDNGDVYTGGWSAGKMNGKGVIAFANGDRFVGNMVDNEVGGDGELTCVTGLVYKGGWRKSKRHGQGHLFYPNKNEYRGEFFNDRICGYGKMIYFNGDEYTGEWLNEMRHGMGTLKLVQGNVYEGQWNNDFMNGQGKMVYPNGDEYTGTWHQGQRVGRGQMMHVNGSTYNGQWDDDWMSGKGVMYYKDGSVYDGNWQRGQRHGYGTVVYPDKSSYEGEFSSDLRHGRGKLIYANNVCFVGEWKADKFDGNGVFSDPNTEYSYQGDWVCGMREGNGVEIWYKIRYEGSWKADMKHGQGIEKSHAGHYFEGTWKDNKKHGRGVRTLRSKIREEQQWHEGHLVDIQETVAEDLPLLPRR